MLIIFSMASTFCYCQNFRITICCYLTNVCVSIIFYIVQNFFIKYGNFWFLWTDFIPRGLACLTLIYLMFYKPIKLNIPLLSRDRDKHARGSDTSSVRDDTTTSSSTTGGARYRHDDDIEEDRSDTENPIRITSGNFGGMGKRSSLEMKSNFPVPPLMTEFFRESEDFDMELEMAMDSR